MLKTFKPRIPLDLSLTTVLVEGLFDYFMKKTSCRISSSDKIFCAVAQQSKAFGLEPGTFAGMVKISIAFAT